MAKKATAKKAELAPVPGLKLDIGCGKNKKEGFIGVDRIKFPGVDTVLDIGRHRWEWKDGSAEALHCSHVLEHLEVTERVHFFNELYRVMKKGAKALIIMPHWASSRYYGDPTHKSPPFSEFGWHYLKKEWRDQNAPHCDSISAPGPYSYSCDFEYSYGFSINPGLVGRSQDAVNFALGFYKEAAMDMMCTLTKVR